MRTKTLLAAAVVAGLGAASAYGQVFSANIVGYVNVDLPKGYSIIANQLNASPDNKIVNVIPTIADNTVLYKYGAAGFTVNTYAGGWDDEAQTLSPGEAAFIFNPGAATKVTFVGEVKTGASTVKLAKGYSLVANPVPQEKKVAELGLPAADNDIVYQYNGGYSVNTYAGGWDDEAAVAKVGSGFFYFAGAAKDWNSTFTP